MTAILNPVKVATNAPLSATAYVEGNYIDSPLRIDDVNIYLDDRVLFKSQTSAVENGVYVVASVSLTEIVGGATQLRNVLVRADDMLADADVFASTIVFVQEGTLFADTGWVITSAPAAGDTPLTVGTNTLTFVRFTINPNVALGDAVLSTLVLRRDKGYPLTNDELDNNFKYLGLSLSEKVDIENYTPEVIVGKIAELTYAQANIDANRVHGYYPSEAALDINYPEQTTVALRTANSEIFANTFIGDLDGSAALLEGEDKIFYTNVNNITSGQLAIEHGGTAATNAATARTNLLVLGTQGTEAMTGKLTLAAATADRASINMTSGTAPTLKVHGDMYAENNQLKYTNAALQTKTVAFLESPVIVTPTLLDNPASSSDSKAVATTHFVKNNLDMVESGLQTQINTKAPIASPTLTGVPKAPDIGKTSTSQIATKTYVDGSIVTNNNFYYTKAQIDTTFSNLKGGSTRTLEQIDNDVQDALANVGIPVGSIVYFAANSVPYGWLEANGAWLSQLTYPRLYEVIGGTYGRTTTKFRLPDLRGEFIRGHDNGRGVDPSRIFGSNQLDEFKSHTHTLWGNDRGTASNQKYAPGLYKDDAEGFTGNASQIGEPNTIRPTGGVETRPRNVAMKACIKVFGEVDDADQILAAAVIGDVNNKLDKAGGSMTGFLTLHSNPTSLLHAATKSYVDTSIDNVSLLPGPRGLTGPTGPQGARGPTGPAGPSIKITSGYNYTASYTNIVGNWNNSHNYFDVYPPSGYSMSNLRGFIASIHVIHYAGGVDGNDSIRCVYQYYSNRIRVWVQGTEQRSNPAANWFAAWS